MRKSRNYLIVGNSVAAIAAIEAIREVDKTVPITVISQEPYRAYSRSLVSHFLEGKVTIEKVFYRKKDFYQRNKVQTILGKRVIAIKPKEKKIVLEDRKRIPYTKLLLTCGSKPILPSVKGIEKKDVFTFTTWDEVKRLAKTIKKAKSAVVIGGGMIGLKAAEGLKSLGLKVTIVEQAFQILPAILDKDGSKIIHRHLKEKGIRLIINDTGLEIRGKGKKVERVILGKSGEVDCDLVVVAIGVTPNLDLVKGTALKAKRGVLVDRFMQTSVKEVYAAGDVVEAYDFLYGRKRPIPVWPLAFQQGRVAGSNMAGKRMEYRGGLILNSIEVFGLPIITAGLSAEEKGYEILTKSDPKKKVYKKIVLRKGQIIGAILVGDIDRAGIIVGLIKDRLDVTNFKDEILEENFGYIYVPKEFRAKMVLPLEVR
ncbi:FAD-dependent oxidoreductase [bacterium]|nr:FAD-dependent oxidoreductase [bacterium]